MCTGLFFLSYTIVDGNAGKVFKGFYLNRIFACFVAWYFVRDIVCFVNNSSYIAQDVRSLQYFYACCFRLVLFCLLLCFTNLLYTGYYNKKCFFNVNLCTVLFVAFFLMFVEFYREVLRRDYYDFWRAVKYSMETKLPMVLFLLIIFHLLVRKLNFMFFTVAVCGVFYCSFLGKRSGCYLGIVSILLFLVFLHRGLKENRRLFYIVGFTGVSFLIFKITNWYPSAGCLFSSRIHMCFHYSRVFLSEGLCTQLLGNGDMLCCVSYPHNVLLALLLSVGIVGAVLWLLSFAYVLVLFFKFKGKGFVDFCLWVILGIYFLNSFTTGFYLYHTPLYFILYFMEYRCRRLREKFAS